MTTEFINEDGYLLIIAGVPWTTEAAKQMIDEAKMEAAKREYRRILFDLTQWAKPDSEMTRFYSGKYLAEAMGYSLKVAAFALPEEINAFGETTAVNRGALFRIFPDKTPAIEWLMAGAGKSDAGDTRRVPDPQRQE